MAKIFRGLDYDGDPIYHDDEETSRKKWEEMTPEEEKEIFKQFNCFDCILVLPDGTEAIEGPDGKLYPFGKDGFPDHSKEIKPWW